MNIPFNRPYLAGNELHYIQEALESGHLSGGGHFTLKCQSWIEQAVGCKKALLTPSCTAALEMAAILLNIEPGDEVIVPSYTFSSTALAFVMRGAIPVFIDIRADTLNIDEQKIKSRITSKTKAIIAVHYAGVACEMNAIMNIARDHNLYVVEDAAQCLLSYYKGKPLGSFGHLAALSFHATKNIVAGEGGALCINDAKFLDRAEIIRDKGTDRKRFLSGEIDKYSWHDLGSSYLMNEITAAFLFAQLERASDITSQRLELWEAYYKALTPLASQQLLNLAAIPNDCQHNAHLFYVILPSSEKRTEVMQFCRNKGIKTATHYVPLHDSVAGKRYGRTLDNLEITAWVNQGLLRLPLWQDLENDQASIIKILIDAIHTANHHKSRTVLA